MDVNESDNRKLLDTKKWFYNIDQIRVLENGEDPNGPTPPATDRPSDYVSVLCTRATPLCQYPIEAACSGGHLDIVKLLIQYGTTLQKRKCLHADAGRRGLDDPKQQIEMLNLLLDQGLNVNTTELSFKMILSFRSALRVGLWDPVELRSGLGIWE